MTQQALPLAVRPASAGQFVETPMVSDLIRRGLNYLEAGLAIHLLGPTGSGKTTLALHIAERLSRPTMLIYGDDEFGTSDLIGVENGFRRTKTVDNFIHSVLKVEESITNDWVDNRLTVACREGYTLIYDEFTRSRPEANNVLLSVLAERVLVLPAKQGRRGYVRVHPEFRAIFTSNPIEYVGTHHTQNALLDRMITIYVPGFDLDTEASIAAARSNVDLRLARQVAQIVHQVRQRAWTEQAPSLRASIMICRVLAVSQAQVSPDDPVFLQTCADALRLHQPDQMAALRRLVAETIEG
jgi:nitric oxide reductase NorQ protein